MPRTKEYLKKTNPDMYIKNREISRLLKLLTKAQLMGGMQKKIIHQNTIKVNVYDL